MKELALMMACLFFYQVLSAQTWQEWFQQNHTQLRYLEEQIAALQRYNAVQSAGYYLTEDRLDSIETTKDDDYMLHEDHFKAQREVDQAITSDPRVLRIASYCDKVAVMVGTIRLWVQSKGGPQPKRAMIREEFANELTQSMESMSERLADLLTPGILDMTDAERERGIGEIESEAGKMYSKAFNFLEHIIRS